MNATLINPWQAAAECADWSLRAAQLPAALYGVREARSGQSEREAVWRDGCHVLYRYASERRTPAIAPVLLVYALVNRPYMADIQPDRSLIRGLLEAGLDVYLIDWARPDRSDRFRTLEDYVLGTVGGAVEHIRAAHQLPAINLLGICQGGVFSLCYAALRPDHITRLITMVTPVDLSAPDNLLAQWIRDVDVEALVDAGGNLSGEAMNWGYLSLKPLRLTAQKYLGLLDLVDDPERMAGFLRMERWIFDSPNQAGAAFGDFVRQVFQQNRLVEGGLQVGDEIVDLARVQMPVLNIYGTEDHLVPPSSARPLGGLIGTADYTEEPVPGGHIGIYVGSRARQLPPKIAAWLARPATAGVAQ